jgi:hypothetical protein
MNSKKLLLTSLLAATALGLSTANAVVLIDNFEGNTVDTAVTGWGTVTGTSGKTFTARVDPTDSGNLVAAAGNTANSNEGFVFALPGGGIANNTTGTLFARFYVANPGITTINDWFGLVDTTANLSNNSFSNFEVQFGFTGTTPDILARNSGTSTDVGNATRGQWYNLWIVANNSTDTMNVYLNQGSSAATAGDLIANNFGFRNGTTDALSHVMINVANVTGSRNSGEAIYWDDIYFDAAGENLAYAVPEPSNYAALAGALALGFVMLRRRLRN